MIMCSPTYAAFLIFMDLGSASVEVLGPTGQMLSPGGTVIFLSNLDVERAASSFVASEVTSR